MTNKKPAIISMHDVMPQTLDVIEHLITTYLGDIPAQHILLLVVPGLPWQDHQINRLKELQQQGFEIAGHGWQHKITSIHSLYHRLHSLLLSRNAAEHLSKTETELQQLLTNNMNWFLTHEFKRPLFYVPPAWALGRISRQTLKRCTFECIETTRGIRNIADDRAVLLPLVGFEADTPIRAIFLRIWNRLNFWWATSKRPLRISIHPYDDTHLIKQQMTAIIAETQTVHWSRVFDRHKPQWSGKTDKGHNDVL